MNDFVFICPITAREIDPGIDYAESDQSGTEGVRFVALHVRCPHCGEHHEIKIGEEALTEAA